MLPYFRIHFVAISFGMVLQILFSLQVRKPNFICLATSISRIIFYWATKNSKQLHQRPLHSERVTVCSVGAKVYLWDSYFLDDEGVWALSMNSDWCVKKFSWNKTHLSCQFECIVSTWRHRTHSKINGGFVSAVCRTLDLLTQGYWPSFF